MLKDDKGKICGVEAEGNGEILEIHAKAVIIATGSISNNPEMIKEYTGRDYEGVQIMAKVSHNTGDGVLLAKEAGAKRAEISALYIGPHNHGKGCSELTGMLIRRPYGIKINRAGDRFIDEGLWTNTDFGWMESYSIDRQPGQVCWAVFSEDLLNEMVEKNEEIGLFEHLAATLDCINKKKKNTDHSLIDSRFDFYDDSEFKGYWMEGLWEEIEKEIQNGRCRKCMNAKEIAEFTGCRYPERIQRTLERYNLFSRNGYDADFQKASEHLGELHPPYYVFLGKSGVDTFIGGVPINYELNVVDEDLYPIEGLYGAGVCTSGWLNNGYAFYGSELSFSFYSGRNAGIQAANYALRKC